MGMRRNSPYFDSSSAISSLYSSGTSPVVNLMRSPFSSSSLWKEVMKCAQHLPCKFPRHACSAFAACWWGPSNDNLWGCFGHSEDRTCWLHISCTALLTHGALRSEHIGQA